MGSTRDARECKGSGRPSRSRASPSCARQGIGGGAVYDALVAATAAEHGMVLLSRDRRARSTYDAIGVRYQIV
ncbi:hypothetical protein D0Z08_16850 [Nocardioides immobilis]|uniref:PIN domain-containing protein n=1 Tax=Nocardioides immobilis TaxID=2049295 RepID=A0A417Y072_9ACTN|nr:PIN domain-containing protein [Nocardioides immobilis]RHW25996.1 hypothetical protein D0Z08_16850 [Nocardioides immobilis]